LASSYTTRSGDTWDAIAARALAEVAKSRKVPGELLMHFMIDANPVHRYVARFDAGVELVVPEIPAADLPSSLPPGRVA
jgi:phage tail protein X